MNVLVQNASIEIEVKRSRFLAETFAVNAQDEARSVLKGQKERYKDAAHVVHAFVIGPTGGILGCSDDGEPSGTAGRPVLDVLRGSCTTNVLVTVSRWFGGTLLGTGGLVKAYGEAAKAVLAITPVCPLVALCDFSMHISYDVFDRFRRIIDTLEIEILSEEFGTEIKILGRVRESLKSDLSSGITNLTQGKSIIHFVE